MRDHAIGKRSLPSVSAD